MSKFKTGKELIGKPGIRNFEFFNDYIKKGLQPYSYFGRPISPPDVALEISLLNSRLKDNKNRLSEIKRILAPGSLEAERARIERIHGDQLAPTKSSIHRTSPSPPTDEDLARKRKESAKEKETVEESIKTLTKKLASIKDFSWKDYSLPGSAKGAEKILDDLIGYLYIKEEFLRINRLIKGPLQKTVTRSAEQEKAIFPCRPGTKWEDITITLIANDMVRIKTPRGEERFTYHELKLSDKRKGDKPKKALWQLLILFAEKNGFISRKNVKYTPMLPDTAKRLNKHLKELFGIQDSIYKAHYKKERGYRTKIEFSDARESLIISKSAVGDKLSQEVKEIFEESKLTMKQIGASQKKKYI